ncbi:MAG: hypothetical protein LBB66_04390 [Desulfovibrio sp.]|jgi:hypothetical protein|nr:hypothetical protein [Desulfovibrio sp.]
MKIPQQETRREISGQAEMETPQMATPGESQNDFGITYDAAIEALRRRSGIPVSSEDPLLDVVTLNNLYLEAMHKLMLRHEGAMKDTMLDVVKGTVGQFEEAVKLLRSNSVENSLAVISRHQIAMNDFLAAMRRLVFIANVFCGVALGASFLALFAVVFRLMRG